MKVAQFESHTKSFPANTNTLLQRSDFSHVHEKNPNASIRVTNQNPHGGHGIEIIPKLALGLIDSKTKLTFNQSFAKSEPIKTSLSSKPNKNMKSAANSTDSKKREIAKTSSQFHNCIRVPWGDSGSDTSEAPQNLEKKSNLRPKPGRPKNSCKKANSVESAPLSHAKCPVATSPRRPSRQT